MAIRIGHASIDENGKAHSGKAGDQTGKECKISNWYNKPWTVVLRPKDSNVAEKSAKACEKLCNSNLVGYDQYERNTLHTQLQKYGYNVDTYIASGIKTETDCSAFQTVLAILAGVTELEYTGNALVCSTMKNAYQKTGKYEILTDSKYTNSSDYLKRGDVLVGNGHTVMVLDNGPKAGSTVVTPPNNNPTKSIDEIANEVINGKWGSGADRKTRLAAAGYDYATVQARVNAILKGESKTPTPTIPTPDISYAVGKSYTLQVRLKVRTGAGTNYSAKTHTQLTADGQKHDSTKTGCLDAGTVITCKDIKTVGKDIWIKCPSGWIAAYYSGKIYIR